ncbi:hypothetical protein DSM03_1011045 [Leeuwenhoekiella aestuarii]|uniref:Uncharacterized protein n=1 Tax=Leeuwenhoekiella aestuarii TaxID=2249426 RepID=A0A4Q0NZH1_9FLAO|nr:hypothetical protein [Leeuwenhoekiella aestuarii]RXG18363.1 hypothetical protein DSM04_101556 [Leeuwenhoekiella aestuarii]RXG19668.1 hypothetical protein DSM03_1011045 [Leeuwenhoekiella aestuarii]
MHKNFSVLFLLFMGLNSFAAVFSNSDLNSEDVKRKSVLALMVDKVAQTYFEATEALGDDIPDFDSSRVKLLLEGMHQATEQMVTLTADEERQERFFKENSTFQEIRQLTLLNLNRAKHNLINVKTKTPTAHFAKFITVLDAARSFCDQLVIIEGNAERVASLRKWTVSVGKSTAEKFEESMGADNLTISQWLGVMKWGGGKTATEDLRELGRKNQAVLIELKKKERAFVKTGAVEEVKVYADTVDGVRYSYADFPPERWSFLYSPDAELTKELIRWLVYINSGNSSRLSDMLSIGIGSDNFDHNVSEMLKTGANIRILKDAYDNQVVLELNSEIITASNFGAVYLSTVGIKNDQIVYYGSSKDERDVKQELQPILVLKNIQGDLLTKIKKAVEDLRLSLGKYTLPDLGLNRY